MKQEMEEELVSNILPFWINRMTDEVNRRLLRPYHGPGGGEARSRKGGNPERPHLVDLLGCIPLAEEAGVSGNGYACQNVLLSTVSMTMNLVEFTGLSNYKGNPLDTKKQIYALGSPSTG